MYIQIYLLHATSIIVLTRELIFFSYIVYKNADYNSLRINYFSTIALRAIQIEFCIARLKFK